MNPTNASPSHGMRATESVTLVPTSSKWLDCAHTHELGNERPQSFSA